MRQHLKKRRTAIALTAILLLGIGATVAWHRFVRLTAAERAVVGRWSRPLTLNTPDDGLHVVEYGEDRSVRMGVFGPDGNLISGNTTIAGKWWVEGDVLFIDYESRPYAGTASRFGKWTGFRRVGAERLVIEASSPEGLQLRGDPAMPSMLHRPYSGGNQLSSDTRTPAELGGN